MYYQIGGSMEGDIEGTIDSSKEIPSTGAYEAALIAYNEGGQKWVEQQLLNIHRQNSRLGKQILNIANQMDRSDISPIAAFYISLSLWDNALNREKSGAILDNIFELDKSQLV